MVRTLFSLFFFVLVVVTAANGEQTSRRFVPLNILEIMHNLNGSMQLMSEFRDNYFDFHKNYDLNTKNFDLLEFVESNLKELVHLNKVKQNNAQITFPNVSMACALQLGQYVAALTTREEWALRVIDAYGKPPSGLLQGSLLWLGEFIECINTTEPNWNGKYCILGQPGNFSMVSMTPAFKYGTCMPDKCNENDIATIINFALENIPYNITSLLPIKINPIDASYVVCQNTSPAYDSNAILAIVIISILVGIVALGTLYDIYKRSIKKFHRMVLNDSHVVDNQTQSVINEDDKEKLIDKYQDEDEPTVLKVLLSFSAYTNTVKLFTVSKAADQLDCLHAIRFLSLAWVILGHVYAFSVGYLDNLAIMNAWFKRFSFLFVSNAFFSVDNFFLLSGLLTSYLFMKEVEKKKGISLDLMFKYYFHRIWRLTPPYMLVLMISATLTKYFGKGPLYPIGGFEINECKNSWWTNLLYINNFVHKEEPCLGVSWYLANDMQFHWFAPVLLIPFALGYKLIGVVVSVTTIVVHIIVTALVLNHYPGSEYGMLSPTPEYFFKVYITPWCRIGPFVIGILLGYAIFTYKKQNVKPKLRTDLNLLAWLFALFFLGLMLFGIYPDFNGTPLSKASHILYQATSRTIWCLALAYIIYACLTSHGGIVNKIFSWSIWTPLSRLSFSAYLIHSVVLLYYIYTQEKPIHFQDSTAIYMFISTLSLSYVAAYLVSIFFEIPLLGLEKFILKK